jgi:gamma-glutamyltranspeptidase/glutathione hydrolase
MLCLPWLTHAETQRPALHGQHWMAITGKPLAATTGAMMFQKGGNAVDSAAAMLAATATMWDVLSWGGETQALIYHPGEKRVIGINALGVAPTGATARFFKEQGYQYPPDIGPLAAVTPGTPGGLMTMLAEWGRLSLAEVLAPAIEMADGYPIEADTVRRIRNNQDDLQKWPATAKVFFPHPEIEEYAGPQPGEIFRQKDLAATLRKLVEAEASALAAGKSRKDSIYAAYERFYRGDIAEELVRSTRELGGLITMNDLDQWQVHIEEPVKTNYKGIDVYKLTTWVQGPVMLQALNILENADLKAMGYNSTRYIHTLYQVMNHAFADRDFYYGDPYFPPEEPIRGLLSKDYARQRFEQINWERNDPDVQPGDPYPYQGDTNPFTEILEQWHTAKPEKATGDTTAKTAEQKLKGFLMGTTAIQAADQEGWIVSVTPSGGWIPAVIAGNTGIGLSQRMQSFVLDSAENPYNVVAPGKRPRVTLTPSLALKDGAPFLSFSVQAGDTQDQNLLQFFLNIVEWDMTPQEAAEAANFTSYQMRGSFGDHPSQPGSLELRDDIPAWTRDALEKMGYELTFDSRTSGPLTAIWFDVEHGTMWGAASNYGEDYGIGW